MSAYGQDNRNTRGMAQRVDAGFAMITAILLIMVIGALSIAVGGVVIGQTKPTQAERKDVGTLNAAQSGFEVVLHRLRAASDSTDANNPSGNGVLSKLPCTMTDKSLGTVLTGPVGRPAAGGAPATAGGFGYSVAVRYYYADPTTYASTPTSTNVAWLRDNTIVCNGSAPSGVPQYALLQANGNGTDVPGSSAGQGDRNLHTTYQFKTTNVNIAGGRLAENTTTPALCMDAGTSPTNGSPVYVKTCGNLGELPSQNWSYGPDLSLHYVASGDPGLCVTGGANASGTALTLAPCQKPTSGSGKTYPYVSPAAQQQEFSFDDNGKFEGAATGGGLTGLCIVPLSSSPTSGAQLYMGDCGGGFNYATWNPDKQTGAGPAGDLTSQLVNYAEFGRCLDVTDQNVSATWLITYPCKQAPDPGKITWNQKFAYSATAHTITTTPSTTAYCLQTPSSGQQVILAPPPCGSSASQYWTETGSVLGDYPSSYEIINKAGQCLSLGMPQGDDYHQHFSTVIVETCDGSLKQKWNAPASLVNSQLKSTTEEQGG